MKVTIGEREIEFDERPRHKAIVAVQNLMTNWLLENINLKDIDGDLPIEIVMKQQVLRNPVLLIEIEEFEESLLIDQTIMLSTGMTYKELKLLKDSLYEDEYIEMYNAATKALGGTADSFFDIYDTNSNSMTKTSKKEKASVSESETSILPPEPLSEISTEPYQAKISTTQD